MKWIKYRIKTTVQAEDLVAAMLSELGIDSVEIEDGIPPSREELDRMFADIGPEETPGEGSAYISFYLGEDTDAKDRDTLLRSISLGLEQLREYADIGEGTIEQSQTEDTDWANNWKQYFHQFYVDDILITPSWEEVSEADSAKMVIRIDPGMAFGTGLHETTQLCVRALKKYIRPGMRVLDVGTGSGILSIASIMLGAAEVFATDLDPCCEGAFRENFEANAIEGEKARIVIGNLTDDEQVQKLAGFARYDIAVSNILADVLTGLAAPVSAALKNGGLWITSGILEGKEAMVEQAMKDAGLKVIEQTRQGEWVCLTAKRE